jgi:hypothetical protein
LFYCKKKTINQEERKEGRKEERKKERKKTQETHTTRQKQ